MENVEAAVSEDNGLVRRSPGGDLASSSACENLSGLARQTGRQFGEEFAVAEGTVPTLLTTTPAARFASCTACEIGTPEARQAASVAITVSPAPDTSKTWRACAGACTSEFSRTRAIPLSPIVTVR